MAKLNSKQRDELLQCLVRRERRKDIAAKFGLTEDGVDYYVRHFGGQIEQLRKERDERILQEGLAVAENRIEALGEILQALLDERKASGLFTEEMKISSTGKVISYTVINEPLLRQIDKYADSIARETGGRPGKQILSGPNNGPVSVEIDDVTNLTPKERANRLLTLLESARTRRDVPPAES